MHPVFARGGRLDLYLSAWLPVAGLLAAALALPARRGWGEAAALALPLALIAAFMSLALWPLCRALPLGRVSPLSLFTAHATAALVSSSVWLLLGGAWAGLLDTLPGLEGASGRLRDDVPLLFVLGMLLFLLAAVVHYLLLAFETAREAERAALELQLHARDAELRALRAQLNPHFLFNSLNAIGALAGSDAAGARQMCVRLSDFLRRSMTLGALPDVTLAEELELVDGYLEIEKARFGDRLRVERTVTPEAAACRVPPLVLQPLVENAVTHGIARTVEGGTLRISAHRRAGRLEISVENPFDPEAARRPGQGVGLQNVRARLAALHPGASRVDCREAYDRFVCEVALPAVGDGPAAARGADAAAGGGAA